jgi:hypothetical protein
MEMRVLRGGSFNNNHRNVRCANRNHNNPNNRNDNIGFRVVVSHIFCPPEMQPGHGSAAEVIKWRGCCPGRVQALRMLPNAPQA